MINAVKYTWQIIKFESHYILYGSASFQLKENPSSPPITTSTTNTTSISVVGYHSYCLIDIHHTSLPANALSSLQPQWEDACQYESEALSWFWEKKTILISLFAGPAIPFTNVSVVGICEV